MKPPENMSAVILAGGKSARMRENKPLLPVQGIPLIQKVAQNLEPYFQEIFISAQSREMFTFLPYPVIVDKEPDQGPLMGILSGLAASANPICFMIACDIPEIDTAFLHRMMSYTRQYEIVVPVSGKDKFEPLFAFYHKCLLPRVENLLKQQIRQVFRLFPLARTKYLPLEDRGWFYNLNNTEDYRKYLEWLSSGGCHGAGRPDSIGDAQPMTKLQNRK
jgi:molybdopterin-guanine dinucleotide biosynthesis protein A